MTFRTHRHILIVKAQLVVLATSLVLATGCTYTTHRAQPMTTEEWAEKYGREMTAVGDAFESISEAVDSYDTDALSDACLDMSRAIINLRDNEPIPDPEVEELWRLAIRKLGEAGRKCATAARTEDPELLDEASEDFRTGTGYLDEAMAALEGK